MNESVAYTLGRMHGLRKQPMRPFFTGWEASQYKQGYIDGAVALENDIERETK
jgi:hypothetical protein